MNGTVRKEIEQLILKLLILILVFYCSLQYVFGITTCNTLDMHPSLKPSDIIFFYKLEEEYKTGSVVALSNSSNISFQRIVAKVGDTVDITDEGLIINGELQDEPQYGVITKKMSADVTYPLTLGYGYYFVLGDNRSDASDSRVIGVVCDDDILGSVIMVMRRNNF